MEIHTVAISANKLLSGRVLTLNGLNRLSSNSVLELTGGELALSGTIGANNQTFSSLVLTNSGLPTLPYAAPKPTHQF